MSSPRGDAVSHPRDALRRIAGDTGVRLLVGLFVLEALVFAFVGPQARYFLSTWTPALFLVLLVPIYAGVARRSRDREERLFWTELTLALGVLLTNYLLLLLLFQGMIPRAIAGLLQALIFAAAYILQLMAAERQPHRSNAWRPRGLERDLVLPSLAVFSVGLVSYFVVVPHLFAPQELAERVPKMMLFIVFDALLTLRFFYLSRIADALRWRLIYAAYGTVMLLFLLSNFTEWTLSRATEWDHFGWAGAFLWSAPYVVLGLPPALARVRYAARSEQPGLIPPWHGALVGSSHITLIWALLVPLVHIFVYQFELLGAPGRLPREMVVLVSVVVLGLVALVQQRVLEQKSHDLWAERDTVEKELRTSENDLRLMVERTRAADRVAREEEKFTRAFRVSHDGLAISTLEEGILVDVNPSFEEMTGYDRDELIGRTVPDGNFWPTAKDRRQVVSALMRDGHLRQVEATVRTRDGAERQMVLSFELLYDSEEHYMLSVLRDVTEDRRLETTLRSQAALLDDARAPIFGIDSDGAVDYANPAARRLIDDDDGVDGGVDGGDVTDRDLEALAREGSYERYAADIREGGRMVVMVPAAGAENGDGHEGRDDRAHA